MKHYFSSQVQRLVEALQQKNWMTLLQEYSIRLFPFFALLFISLLFFISMYTVLNSHKGVSSEASKTLVETLS